MATAIVGVALGATPAYGEPGNPERAGLEEVEYEGAGVAVVVGSGDPESGGFTAGFVEYPTETGVRYPITLPTNDIIAADEIAIRAEYLDPTGDGSLDGVRTVLEYDNLSIAGGALTIDAMVVTCTATGTGPIDLHVAAANLNTAALATGSTLTIQAGESTEVPGLGTLTYAVEERSSDGDAETATVLMGLRVDLATPTASGHESVLIGNATCSEDEAGAIPAAPIDRAARATDIGPLGLTARTGPAQAGPAQAERSQAGLTQAGFTQVGLASLSSYSSSSNSPEPSNSPALTAQRDLPLAATGTSSLAAPALAGAALLLAVGGGLMIAARRRRSADHSV